MLGSRKRNYITCLLLIVFCSCGLIAWLYPSSVYIPYIPITVDTRTRPDITNSSSNKQTIHTITRNLYLVIAELQNHTKKNPWVKDSLKVLIKTIALLDSIKKTEINTKNVSQEKSQVIGSVKSVTEKTEKVPKELRIQPDVCPDTFVHANRSEPYFVNGSWARVKCTQQDKQVKDILTVLLNPPSTNTCSQDTNALIENIRKTHPGVPIIVATDVKKCSVEQKNVLILKREPTSGKTWNALVDKVTTKYMLLGRRLDNFSWLTHVERQLAVLSDVNSNIDIVGGAVRNKTGHWEVGCYQSKLKFYQLIYTDGYYKSKNECMFCDYVKGPFIAKKSLFQNISFDPKMTRGVVFEEFFLRLTRNDNVVVCPDAMYFATDVTANEKVSKKTTWLPLVKKLELNRVVLPDDVRHRYTCDESGSTCRGLTSTSGSSYMPVCCMDRVVYSIKMFHEYCLKHNIRYYVLGGTALGAVKFRNMIPWDFDGDILYYLANETFFESNKTPFAGEKKPPYFGNFHMKWFGYFRINTPDFYIEMIGVNETANEHVGMTELFTRTPTKVRIRGEWFYGPPSPGLYARQQYGKELLKHANSWISQGHLWFDPYKVQPKFWKCRKPGHHFCYDTSPTDGSFGFVVP